MKRIVFIVDSLFAGGAGRVVSEVGSELSRRYDVSIITVFEKRISYSCNENIRIISITDCVNGQLKEGFTTRIKKINTELKNISPDIVVSFLTEINVYTLLASIGQKWKVIISERGDPVFSPRQKRVRVLRKLTYFLADGYVFQTKEAKDFFPLHITKRSTIIVNPLSSNLPTSIPECKKNKIVSVGRLNSLKNFEMAIRTISILKEEFPDIKYEVFGDGNHKAHLQELIDTLDLQNNIELKGQTNDVFDAIIDANLFLLTSNHEGLSNALIEAIALGLPVISTDVGGASSLIEKGNNGYVIDVGDTEDLAVKIRACLLDTSIKSRALDYSVSFRERLNVQSITSEWEKYISTVENN